MSKRRRHTYHRRLASAGVASVAVDHSHTGLGAAPLERWSMSRRITVPSTIEHSDRVLRRAVPSPPAAHPGPPAEARRRRHPP
jgi:hypothetical protein